MADPQANDTEAAALATLKKAETAYNDALVDVALYMLDVTIETGHATAVNGYPRAWAKASVSRTIRLL